MKRKITIDYLYLDLQSCERCIGTDMKLEEVLRLIQPLMKLIDYQITYRKIQIQSIELAEKYHFLSSPTIRINDVDINSSVIESECDCCSNISGAAVNCRVFKHEEHTYEIPTVEMLTEAILKAIFCKEVVTRDNKYLLPQNLRKFFEGKEKKNNQCSCKNDCC